MNITAGVLYQYDPAAADDLKKENAKVAAKRAEKPVEDFVSVLDEVPGVLPTTKIFHRGDHRQPTKPVRPGDLTIAAPEGSRYEIPEKDACVAHLRPQARLRPTSRQGGPSPRGPGAGESHLAESLRPRAGRYARRLRRAGHAPDPPGIARLAGRRARPPGMVSEAHAQTDHDVRGLSPIVTRRRQAGSAADSSNTLYGHFPLRRLEAEEIRDVILHVSGRLDETLYGPPVPVAEDAVGHILPDNDSARRSLYLQARRTKPVSLLATFDFPTMAVNCDRRAPTTSATQSLVLMNSDFILSHAGRLAQPRARAHARGLNFGPVRPAGGMRLEARLPAPDHARRGGMGRASMAPGSSPTPGPDRELAVLTNLCQQLLISNEFLYVD